MRAALIALSLVCATCAHAGDVLVAVAANFSAPMERIAREFESSSGHRARLAFGATGALASQVRHGAPFDVLLAADDETPARLEKEGLAVAGSRFTYATGRLVLWSAREGVVDAQGAVLSGGNFEHLAVTDPKLAPYGRAAVEALQRLGVYDRVAPRIVWAENITQAHQFVASGNAALGFVALSQVQSGGRAVQGSAWIVPASLHAPIRQDGVLLAHGRSNAAAAALAAFLRGEKARGIIRAYGYELQ